ncbi:hypothetical protein [Actinoplanes sp. NPDC051851]|uniref:hypothetical protein n=1 Tax=Actinoplanes sp. NPDC051851 TaxID=3154753 RepID=UPI00341E6497
MAETIHGGVQNNYYQVPPDATPREKFEAALKFLASEQVTTARKLLDEVLVHGHDPGRTGFYWLLAFFSGRTYWELSPAERNQVTATLKRVVDLPDDEWSPGIRVVQRLFAAAQTREDDPSAAPGLMADLDRLRPGVRELITRHLDRMLQGSLKDGLWQREVEKAGRDQMADNRRWRVWKFFEADPKPPRMLEVRAATASIEERILASTAAVILVGACGTLGWLVQRRGDTAAIVVLLCAVVLGSLGVHHGAKWRSLAERQRDHDQQRRSIRFGRAAPRRGGFADQVNRLYTRYSQRCAPEDGPERAAWFADSFIPMCRLRDDLVEAYREKPVGTDRVKWLIRFQVKDMRRRWADGEPLDPRPTVPMRLRAGTAACAAATLICALWVFQSALRQDVLRAVGALLLVLLAGTVLVAVGLRILADRERADAERRVRDQRMDSYRTEYQRWRDRLSDRPTDMEMARWLECDRRILLDRALRGYKLKWSDVEAYACLEARGPGGRRARVKNGPWRYTRYRPLVFLLTADGVRQLTTELDFERGTFHHPERTNYRYHAVAAVRVTVRYDDARNFRLFLVNGTDIDVDVNEGGQPESDEDRRILEDAVQDVTGLRHTLFVLEGVAAEGRRWWSGPAYRRAS